MAERAAHGHGSYQREVKNFDLAYMLGLPDWLPRFQPPSVHRAPFGGHRRVWQALRFWSDAASQAQ